MSIPPKANSRTRGFTDDDLKRLKRVVKLVDGWTYDLPFNKWEALLSRLEAAEKLIGYRETRLGYDKYLNRWRASKGARDA